MNSGAHDSNLAARITRDASHQTYFTVRLLVDRQLQANAFRAYAYFRWVDDYIDDHEISESDRLAFIDRQKTLIEKFYNRENPPTIFPEEYLLVKLIQSDTEKNSGLQIYIRNMMDVMIFDANRRGRLVSHIELANYTRSLATAVTEALHYFIGHNQRISHDYARYFSATAAHITHMLRDTAEDVCAGYYNIPGNYLLNRSIDPLDTNNPAYREWIRSRVELARQYFLIGKEHLNNVPNIRCLLAGYAYTARFEQVLTTIENDDFMIRLNYDDFRRPRDMAILGTRALFLALRTHRPSKRYHPRTIQ